MNFSVVSLLSRAMAEEDSELKKEVKDEEKEDPWRTAVTVIPGSKKYDHSPQNFSQFALNIGQSQKETILSLPSPPFSGAIFRKGMCSGFHDIWRVKKWVVLLVQLVEFIFEINLQWKTLAELAFFVARVLAISGGNSSWRSLFNSLTWLLKGYLFNSIQTSNEPSCTRWAPTSYT